MIIYIIRHGETDLNAQGRLQGWLDVPLNDSGVALAEVTGRAMRGIRFDRCWSSPLTRAQQTARIILRESGNADTPIDIDPRIKEVGVGVWEGLSTHELNDRPEGALIRAFFTDPFGIDAPAGGESARDVCRRTQAFLAELAARDDDSTVLVSTHGFALRAMLNALYDDPSDFWQGHAPYNCAVSILSARAGRVEWVARDKLYYDPGLAVDRYSQVGR